MRLNAKPAWNRMPGISFWSLRTFISGSIEEIGLSVPSIERHALRISCSGSVSKWIYFSASSTSGPAPTFGVTTLNGGGTEFRMVLQVLLCLLWDQ